MKSKANCFPSVYTSSGGFRKIIELSILIKIIKLSGIWEQREELAFDLPVSFTVSLMSILSSSKTTCEFTSSVTLRWCRLAQATFLS